jgi:adenylate cyclase
MREQDGGLSGPELAKRSGATDEQVDRLAELGVITPSGTGGFTQGDVRRVKLAMACERSGLELERIGAAISDGRFSLAFMDLLPWSVGAYGEQTYAEACDGLGLPLARVQRIFEACGFVRPEPEDPVSERDQDILAGIAIGMGIGLDDGTAVRTTRVYGENLRRLTQAEAQFYHAYVEGPLLASGLDEREMRETATEVSRQVVPVVERMLLGLYYRHQERFMIEDLVEHIEAIPEVAGPGRGARASTMGFLDLAGYTRLTEEQGDEAAAALVTDLAELVERVALPHGGQPVKWLGDGVMFHFREAGPAVLAALEMVRSTPEIGLPPAHVGLHTGPVVVQDGDYYGRTVNLAARVANRAGPSQILVTDEVVATGQLDGVTYHPVGAVRLKGVTEPVELHEARRPNL